MSNTVQQIINPVDGWVEVTAAVAAGLFSVSTSCNFALSDSGAPDEALFGHGLSPNEPRRYNIEAPTKLYIKVRGTKVIVSVTED